MLKLRERIGGGLGGRTLICLPSLSWHWARYFPHRVMRPLSKSHFSSISRRAGPRIREVKTLAQVTQLVS